ncbi:MAG TPA: hypothetical protein VG028_05620 [Terriglobia bacterium]|nr:hypothetical protein [Terriglobia bacterium]
MVEKSILDRPPPADTFLIVTRGITIRDRLRVVLPNDPDNYCRHRDQDAHIGARISTREES